MIRKYRFGTPFETDAVVEKQPDAAVFAPDSTPEVPFFQVSKVDANAQTDGSAGFPSMKAEKPVKDAWQFRLALAEADIVYGLGEALRGINKRGWLYLSDNADDPNHLETKTNLYGSHNFLIVDRADGKGSFGIFLDDPGVVRFDVGYTRRDQLVISSAGTDFDLYFFTGADDSGKPLAITREFRKMIGKSYIPPKWGFGYGQSRWGYKNEADVREIASRYRKAGIPLDSIYLDIDYMVGYKDFTVDTKAFPDLAGLSADLKKDGIRLVPIIDAGIKVVEGDEMGEEGIRNGYFCTNPDGTPFQGAVWPGLSYFTDYLNPEARKWFGRHYKVLLDQGIEGFWNDMNEPSVFYTNDSLRSAISGVASIGDKKTYETSDYHKMMFAANGFHEQHQYYRNIFHHVNGKTICHDDVHNLYGYNMTRAAGEAFEELEPDKRILMFSRSSYIGMHRYGGIWTGDNCAWWAHLQQVVKQMPGLNMVGLLYTGSDTGGFGGNTTEDLLVRWIEFSLFNPLFRNHASMGTRQKENDLFTNTPAMADIIGVRYALLPYLYSEYVKAARNDDMYFKPLSFVYEGDQAAKEIEDQLMVGESLMIAPVVTQNASGRMVYFPEDMRMIRFRSAEDYDTEEMKAGWHYVSCKLYEVLVFLRKGHLLPTAAAAQSVSALDEQNLRVYAYGDGVYDLYQDDGFTKDYENPEHMKPIKVENGEVSAEGLAVTLR